MNQELHLQAVMLWDKIRMLARYSRFQHNMYNDASVYDDMKRLERLEQRAWKRADRREAKMLGKSPATYSTR